MTEIMLINRVGCIGQQPHHHQMERILFADWLVQKAIVQDSTQGIDFQQLGARTLRIRTTEAFAGGRPQIAVNSWTSSAPSAPTSIDSRGYVYNFIYHM